MLAYLHVSHAKLRCQATSSHWHYQVKLIAVKSLMGAHFMTTPPCADPMQWIGQLGEELMRLYPLPQGLVPLSDTVLYPIPILHSDTVSWVWRGKGGGGGGGGGGGEGEKGKEEGRRGIEGGRGGGERERGGESEREEGREEGRGKWRSWRGERNALRCMCYFK